jgi:hypothetical protein
VNLSICDVCDDYCDIYDACDEYYDIYDVCDEYYDIYDIPVIFGYFKREKQKNAMATLSCVLWKTHGKVDKTNSRNSAFVVHLKGRTVKVPFIAVRFVPRRTAKSPSLSCVLCHGARQRAHLCRAFCASTHCKGRHTSSHPGAVSCFFCRVPRENARQRLFIMRCQARHTAKGLYRAKCYRVPFVMRPDEKRTTKSLSCILGPLPCAYGARQTHYFP